MMGNLASIQHTQCICLTNNKEVKPASYLVLCQSCSPGIYRIKKQQH